MYTKFTHIFQTNEQVVMKFNKMNADKKNLRSVQEMWLVFSGKNLNNFCKR